MFQLLAPASAAHQTTSWSWWCQHSPWCLHNILIFIAHHVGSKTSQDVALRFIISSVFSILLLPPSPWPSTCYLPIFIIFVFLSTLLVSIGHHASFLSAPQTTFNISLHCLWSSSSQCNWVMIDTQHSQSWIIRWLLAPSSIFSTV